MEVLRVMPKQLILDLDKNGVPVGWRWSVDRIVDFGDGRGEQVVPGFIPATAKEVEQRVGVAVGKQAEDIRKDSEERDSLKARAEAAELKLEAITRADATYDATVKPLLQPVQ